MKEATDTVYNACLTVITSHLTYYLSKENDQNRDSAFVKQTILPLLIKGVSDKKSFYRKGYMHGLWSSCKSDHALNLLGVNGVEQLVVLALDVLEKVQAAGISVIDPKKETPLLVEGYYGLHWLLLVLEWAKSLGPAGQNIG